MVRRAGGLRIGHVGGTRSDALSPRQDEGDGAAAVGHALRRIPQGRMRGSVTAPARGRAVRVQAGAKAPDAMAVRFPPLSIERPMHRA